VEFLVGFNNKGDADGIESPPDFVVETLDASFRYPMDFSFHIQNFSAIAYHKTVKPGQEATVAYSFIPADAFAGRAIGLTINLNYRDSEGNFYFDPVFNETVQIVEFDEGFDTEVFFMYVFMAAGAILLLFLAFSFLSSRKGSKKHAHKKVVETGTANDDVDYEWIPRSALHHTPGSNKTSPRQRKGNRHAGSDTE
jgi:translocon-associated protein subunit alpha